MIKKKKIDKKSSVVKFNPDQLQQTFGSENPDFAKGLLNQLINIGSQGREIDEDGTAFVTSIVMEVKPNDQIEAMLAAQMAAIHNATMTFARRLAHVDNIQQQESASKAFNQLSRTFTAQIEALKRHRTGGHQHVTVKHVTVQEGGQAIVGNVGKRGGGCKLKIKDNPMQSAHSALRCSAKSKRTGKPCRSPAVKNWSVCRMHGARGGAPTGIKNGQYKHGYYTHASTQIRMTARYLIRESEIVLKDL